MSKTRAQLIDKVLANLNVGGGNPSDDEVGRVDLVVDDVVQGLAARDIYFVSDAGVIGPAGGTIEPAIFQELAAVVTEAAALEFDDNDPKYVALADRAIDRMRIVSAPSRSIRILKVDPALRRRRYGIYNGGF